MHTKGTTGLACSHTAPRVGRAFPLMLPFDTFFGAACLRNLIRMKLRPQRRSQRPPILLWIVSIPKQCQHARQHLVRFSSASNCLCRKGRHLLQRSAEHVRGNVVPCCNLPKVEPISQTSLQAVEDLPVPTVEDSDCSVFKKFPTLGTPRLSCGGVVRSRAVDPCKDAEGIVAAQALKVLHRFGVRPCSEIRP